MVQAASTDAWEGFRARAARLLARGDAHREAAELRRLDETAVVLKSATPSTVDVVRIRQDAVWEARFKELLEGLAAHEQERAAAELRYLLSGPGVPPGGVSAGPGGFAAGGNADIRAGQGSVAGGVVNVHGGIHHGGPATAAKRRHPATWTIWVAVAAVLAVLAGLGYATATEFNNFQGIFGGDSGPTTVTGKGPAHWSFGNFDFIFNVDTVERGTSPLCPSASLLTVNGHMQLVRSDPLVSWESLGLGYDVRNQANEELDAGGSTLGSMPGGSLGKDTWPTPSLTESLPFHFLMCDAPAATSLNITFTNFYHSNESLKLQDIPVPSLSVGDADILGLILVTIPELLRQLRGTVIPAPRRDNDLQRPDRSTTEGSVMGEHPRSACR